MTTILQSSSRNSSGTTNSPHRTITSPCYPQKTKPGARKLPILIACVLHLVLFYLPLSVSSPAVEMENHPLLFHRQAFDQHIPQNVVKLRHCFRHVSGFPQPSPVQPFLFTFCEHIIDVFLVFVSEPVTLMKAMFSQSPEVAFKRLLQVLRFIEHPYVLLSQRMGQALWQKSGQPFCRTAARAFHKDQPQATLKLFKSGSLL